MIHIASMLKASVSVSSYVPSLIQRVLFSWCDVQFYVSLTVATSSCKEKSSVEKNTSTRSACSNVFLFFVFFWWWMGEDTAHCGQWYPWANGSGFCKKATQKAMRKKPVIISTMVSVPTPFSRFLLWLSLVTYKLHKVK